MIERIPDVAENLAGQDEQKQSFALFFDAHYRSIAGGLYLSVGNAHEAEDLAQEAFARAYERWERVRAMDSPVGYVYQTAMNIHRKRLRRARLTSRILIGASPNQIDESDSARTEVQEALAALPSAQAQALVLVEWLGLTADEAGGVLGITGSSVRGRIYRARLALKSHLKEG